VKGVRVFLTIYYIVDFPKITNQKKRNKGLFAKGQNSEQPTGAVCRTVF